MEALCSRCQQKVGEDAWQEKKMCVAATRERVGCAPARGPHEHHARRFSDATQYIFSDVVIVSSRQVASGVLRATRRGAVGSPSPPHAIPGTKNARRAGPSSFVFSKRLCGGGNDCCATGVTARGGRYEGNRGWKLRCDSTFYRRAGEVMSTSSRIGSSL